MVAGFLILGIVSGFGAAGAALFAGQTLWVSALAYMLGGMLGLGLSITWGLIVGRFGLQPDQDCAAAHAEALGPNSLIR